jgi:hypothetical protein
MGPNVPHFGEEEQEESKRKGGKNLWLRFEVFTAGTRKNGAFWDVTPCGSCKNRRFGGT